MGGFKRYKFGAFTNAEGEKTYHIYNEVEKRTTCGSKKESQLEFKDDAEAMNGSDARKEALKIHESEANVCGRCVSSLYKNV